MGSKDSRPRHLRWVVPLMPLAASLLVYHGLVRDGYFMADDFVNLYEIANLRPLHYLLIPNCGHVLLARNAVFFGMAHLFGAEPSGYFTTVVATHLLNVGLLFEVIRRFTASRRLACFGATLWGMSPLQEGTLGWYSVYGHMLVATALLWLLLRIAHRAALPHAPIAPERWLWYAVALVACACFGVGIAIAMVLPLVLFLLLPEWRSAWRLHLPLISLAAVVPALYALLAVLHVATAGDTQLLTVCGRPSLSDLPSAALVTTRLLGIGLTGLLPAHLTALDLHFAPSGAVLAIAALLSAAIATRSSRTIRRQLAAWWLLAVACYALIAVGRAGFYRDLPYVFLAAGGTRYHYVALIGLTLMLCTLIGAIGDRLPVSERVKTLALVVWLAVAIGSYEQWGFQQRNYAAFRATVDDALSAIRAQVDATPAGEIAFIPNRPLQWVTCPLIPMVRFPGWAGLFVIRYPDNVVDRRATRFIEADENVRRAALQGRRSANLFVAPAARP